MLKSLIRKIISNFAGFHKVLTSIVLYRDLMIIRALPRYSVHTQFFFGEQLSVSISEPSYLDPELPLVFQDKLGIHSPVRKYCNIFKDVQILGGNFPIVLNAERKPLWNAIAYQFFNWERYYTPIRWFIQSHSNAQVINEEYAFLLYSAWSSNYFHWLLDNLARLQALDFLDSSITTKTKILIAGKLSLFQLSAMSALDIKNIEYIEDNNYNVKNLLVPNFPLEQQGYDLDQIVWLKKKIFQRFGDTEVESNLKRVLILRKNTSGRSFINQEEILNVLTPIGFNALYLEELSFEEQVSLFKQANWIIAAHGAGLANMIFSDSANIIEIFGADVFPCYFQLAKTIGLNYGFLQCNNMQSTEGDKNRNLIVNIPHLLKLISQMD